MQQRLEEIIEVRRKKLQLLKDKEIDPYPSTTSRTHANAEALEAFQQLQGKTITLVGRIRSWRAMGKIVFCHIEDGTAKLQVLVKEENVKEAFSLFTDAFDIGDFIECTGTLFETKTKEKTLEASSVRMLAKSLLPLPTEHYGLRDEETRLRKRYLDILMNPDVKELFIKKNAFWSSMRSFLTKQGFLEVEMPVLESVPGGAEAEPFITHHNALDRNFFLRISLELPLKKMLVAGYEKVFEIGRIFRNEGMDTEHLQDYTQLEFYWAYASFNDLMTFARELYQTVIQETFGTLNLPFHNETIHWGGEWQTLDYFTMFHKHTGIDLDSATKQKLKAYADKQHIACEPSAGKGRIIDLIFKKKIRSLPEISMQPAFLINQPVEVEPLAKRVSGDPNKVQRLQILACGTELGKGFGELNDPVDQRERFAEQMRMRKAGDDEAQRLDEDYVEAMEYGMPPAAGFGVSERLFAVLNDKSIRETAIFPLMK